MRDLAESKSEARPSKLSGPTHAAEQQSSEVSLQALIRQYTREIPSGRGDLSKRVIKESISNSASLLDDLSLFQDFLIAHTDYQRGIITEKALIEPPAEMCAVTAQVGDSEEYKEAPEEGQSPDLNARPKSVSGYRREVRGRFNDSLEKRPLPNDALVELNNLLLRCLSITRGIQHVLTFEQQSAFQESLLNHFKVLLKKLTFDPSNDFDDYYRALPAKMLQAERNYNVRMMEVLSNAGLAPGVTAYEDCEALLLRYRFFARILDPMPAIQTVYSSKLSFEVEHDGEVQRLQKDITCTKTAFPITNNTDSQKESIAVLLKKNLFPSDDEKNSHTLQAEAFQIVHRAFAGQLSQEGYALGSQARNFLKDTGALNAFFNTLELEGKVQPKSGAQSAVAPEKYAYSYMTSGSPVYAGKGESYDAIRRAAQDNIVQLASLVGEAGLHVITLLSNSSIRPQETRVYRTVRHLSSTLPNENRVASPVSFSQVPTNELGMFQFSRLATELEEAPSHRLFLSDPKAYQAKKAAGSAQQKGLGIALLHCMAGQDRTWVVATELDIELLESWGFARDVAERLIAMLMHSPLVTTIAAPGSPGIQPLSRAGWLFSSMINDHWFSRSALTNKSAPMSKTLFNDALKIRYLRVSVALAEFARGKNTSALAIKNLLQEAHGIRRAFPSQLPVIVDTLERTHALLSCNVQTSEFTQRVAAYRQLSVDLRQSNHHRIFAARALAVLSVVMMVASAALVPVTGGLSFATALTGFKLLSLSRAMSLGLSVGTGAAGAAAGVTSVGLYQLAGRHERMLAPVDYVAENPAQDLLGSSSEGDMRSPLLNP